ncbi:hypothetical protein CCHR01_18619 [Colletotrichum chrysophilum]|uniref:Uncharacterized protein n=1 Tax=Colletotrichum chrysophilum TaxID=1836956 RepID=A0AAD9A006_9PEZI|nr:hypothetical protein CCHR01_18619 [Colletotrichum chrysophilum]
MTDSDSMRSFKLIRAPRAGTFYVTPNKSTCVLPMNNGKFRTSAPGQASRHDRLEYCSTVGVTNSNPSRDLDPIRRLTRAECDIDELTDCGDSQQLGHVRSVHEDAVIVVVPSHVFLDADYRQKDGIKIEMADVPVYLEIRVRRYRETQLCDLDKHRVWGHLNFVGFSSVQFRGRGPALRHPHVCNHSVDVRSDDVSRDDDAVGGSSRGTLLEWDLHVLLPAGLNEEGELPVDNYTPLSRIHKYSDVVGVKHDVPAKHANGLICGVDVLPLFLRGGHEVATGGLECRSRAAYV